MINSSRIKITVVFLFLIALSIALYIRRPKLNWDKGLLSISERNYYSNRFERIIKNWQQTAHEADVYSEDIMPESYQTYLIIDLEKKAFWLEEKGKIRAENYIDLSPKTNWILYHITPEGNTELPGRTALKIRGINLVRITPERFYLVGQGLNGCLVVDFNLHYENAHYSDGSFVIRRINFQAPIVSADKIYHSILVTNDEYRQYFDTLPDSKPLITEDEKIKAWNKIEKYLYMEIEKQFPKNGYNLGNISIEPGPDFSAARAHINARKGSILERITGHKSKNEVFNIDIDNLGDDIWYGKSVPNPYTDLSKTDENTRALNIEFIASSNGIIKGSKRRELLKKGRGFQLAALIPESKWKATLSNGTKFEFLGIHENTNPNTQWWGPDGSYLDYIPNYNNEPYDKFFIDKNIFEVAWRTTPSTVSNITLEGSTTDYSHQLMDRYGNTYPALPGVKGFSFRNRPQVTTFKAKLSITDWKVPLQIKNKSREINFLNRKRIILNPPEIENERLIVKCYEESHVELTEYKTDFAIIVNDGLKTKIVTLAYCGELRGHIVEEGMDEHAYIIKDYKIDQIEGVCFRYQPYSFVIFKNISLVPGKNQGFEIEVQEAEEK
ncbi:MAG: hypothetical protein P8016_12035 [Sedimentisphaerales bacterium]